MDKMIVQGDWFSIGGLIWANDRKPTAVGKIYGDHRNCGQEEVVFSQNLFIRLQAEEVSCSFWDEYAISLVVISFGCQLCKEFA